MSASNCARECAMLLRVNIAKDRPFRFPSHKTSVKISSQTTWCLKMQLKFLCNVVSHYKE